MKKLWLFLLLFSFSFHFTQAQYNPSNQLRLRMSDGSLLKVVINNRAFKKINNSLIINDIPNKRPHIMAYRYRPYADGRGGRAELIYSGTITIKKGRSYDGIIDVKRRVLLLKEVSSFYNETTQNPQAPYYKDQAIEDWGNEDGEFDPDVLPEYQQNPELNHSNQQEIDLNIATNASENFRTKIEALRKAMDQLGSDTEKTKLVNKELPQSFSTKEAVYIAEGLFFDDTKMEFFKNNFNKIEDPTLLNNAVDCFTSESSKKDFLQFLKQKNSQQKR